MSALALLLTLAATVSAAPTPPPTIITIKSSPLCDTVRNVVAPALTGMVVQDRMLTHGNVLLDDMATMQAEGGGAWVDMDNHRLGRIVLMLAKNNIEIHQLLDKLDATQLKSAEDERAVADLRARLFTVADRQAEALNVLSGESESLAADELQGFTNPMAAALAGDPRASTHVHDLSSPPPSDSAPASGNVAAAGHVGAHRDDAESLVLPALEPLLERCR